MYTSAKLKNDNLVGYLLYMWQVEDVIRANDMDLDKIGKSYVSRFGYDDDQRANVLQWFADLVDMMRSEGVAQSGHLQINRNVVILLGDLHSELLKSSKHPFYSAAYYKVLPFIVELRNKSNGTDKPEIENCFDALYGFTTLRMQQKEVSAATKTAIGEIASFLALLADYHKKDKAGELEM